MSRSTTTYNAYAIEQIAAALPAWYRENEAMRAGMTSTTLRDLSEPQTLLDASDHQVWLHALSPGVRAALGDPRIRTAAIGDLTEPLIAAETVAATRAAATSLISEGFMTRVVVDGSLGFVEARRGHETLLVEVDGPTITRDRAGLDDETCATSDSAFEEQMARRGFRLVAQQVTEHRAVPGGELIRTAARHNRRNLAEGAAQARRIAASSSTSARMVAS